MGLVMVIDDDDDVREVLSALSCVKDLDEKSEIASTVYGSVPKNSFTRQRLMELFDQLLTDEPVAMAVAA